MAKVVGAFVGCKCLEELVDELPERLDGARSALAQGGLELGESLLDRVEVGRVRWKIAQGCFADCIDGCAHVLDLVGAQVVQEDDATLVVRCGKTLLDTSQCR